MPALVLILTFPISLREAFNKKNTILCAIGIDADTTFHSIDKNLQTALELETLEDGVKSTTGSPRKLIDFGSVEKATGANRIII